MSRRASVLIHPDESKTPRQGCLSGRILAAVGQGTGTNSTADLWREFGASGGGHQFHKRLYELVSLGWVERTLTITEAGRAALDRMREKS